MAPGDNPKINRLTPWLLASLVGLLAHRQVAAQGPPARWQLSARPSVTIGRRGDRHTDFLRIGKVLRLPGGEIAVPNGASNEIRIFDRAGRYLRALGRGGAGPGEFKSLSLLGRSGDTLFIWDGTSSRITQFLAGGTLVKTIPVTARDSIGRFFVVGRFRDGRWAVRTTSSPSLYGPERTYRDTSRVGVIGSVASGPVTWLGEFPGTTFFVYNPGGGPQGDVAAAVPLGPMALSALSGDEVLIGDTGGNVIGAYLSAATVLRLIELPLEALPLADDRIARLLQQALKKNPSQRARSYLTALYSRTVLGGTLPVFSDMVPAPDGWLWVQQGAADSEESSPWLILDSSGAPKASLLTPPGFRITEVGPSYVLGVHTDADGVETVRLYQLTSR
jgi:hypothetical protein